MPDEMTPESLGTLLWRLPVAVYRTNPAGRFLAANPELLELLGAESTEQLGDLDVRSLYVDPAQRDLMVKRVESGETIPPEEIRLRRLDGSEIWVRVAGSPAPTAPSSTSKVSWKMSHPSVSQSGA